MDLDDVEAGDIVFGAKVNIEDGHSPNSELVSFVC